MMQADTSTMLYRVAFSRIKGMTVAYARILLDSLGTEEALFTLPMREIERIAGVSPRHFNDDVRSAALGEACKQIEFATSHGIRVIYFTDDDYPRRLLECEDAPMVLYVKGNADLNPVHSIGIVGTRNATHYGISFINKLVDDLSAKIDGLQIISGLALGCDIAAHRRAMHCGVPTVGVVAHGLDTIYPAENRNDAAKMATGAGAVLTDYPTETRPFRGNFLARNRIVAGMTDCLVVVESAANHGGALHTARLARDYDREVFALPGRSSDLYSGGCNRLIQRHVAQLCMDADDIIAAMGWTPRPVEGAQQQLFRDLSAEEQSVIDYLRTNNGDVQINVLTAGTGIPVGRLMGMMMELEMDGLVMALPGSRFRLA